MVFNGNLKILREVPDHIIKRISIAILESISVETLAVEIASKMLSEFPG